MDELLLISSIVVVSFIVAIFVDRIGVPRVSTYVLIGVLLSPDLLGGFFHLPEITFSNVINKSALGIIAFLIGVKIKWDHIKDLKKLILAGAFGEIIGAVLFVYFGLLTLTKFGILDINSKIILSIAAVAATTAPASTLGVIEEYKAQGKMTTLLLGIVILDDALGVISYEFLSGLGGTQNLLGNLQTVSLEILFSLFIGSLCGFFLGFLTRKFRDEELRFPLFLGFILLLVSLGHFLNFSSILACMFLGLITQLVSDQEPDCLVLPIKHIEEFIFIIFFVLAGLHFDYQVIRSYFLVLLAYVLLRASGKYIGALIGLRLSGCEAKTSSLLGFGLLPQAGVAIGLALSLSMKKGFEEEALIVFNVILGSTVIYELLGPLVSKAALKKAGEIT